MKKQYKLGISLLGDHVEMIHQIGWEAMTTSWNRENLERWANEAARCGLFYQSIHAPFSGEHRVSRLWQEGERGQFVADQLIECVKDCARFSIPVMVLHPFCGFKDHTPTQVGMDHFSRIVETANQCGVTLAFENLEGEEYLAALMQKFWNEPCCGFCLDTGHEMCYNGGRDMLALYGEKLCHTHLNDNLGIVLPPETPIEHTWHNDLHLPMGDGIVDWKNVMDRIEALPYDGPLICELTRKNKPDRNDHDKYAAMSMEEFYAFALDRARRVCDRSL